MLNFKQWFNETMTSTSCVAGFARRTIPMVSRDWMPFFGEEPNTKKKKEYRQPQVEEQSLSEQSLQCQKCKYGFTVPDWLDTKITCPKCSTVVKDPTQPKPGTMDDPRWWDGHDGTRDPFGRL